ncbi:MAG: phosphoribosylanthranilate isomerase [Phycisphaeraceae bacterium]|nr:phosphoribosylanthranilate isomerase [Phycisphaeraceae bacterium]
MSRTRIKICGFRDRATLFNAVEHEVEQGESGRMRYFGLNMIERSPRYVTPAQASDILRAFYDTRWMQWFEPVLLFANHSAKHIIEVTRELLDETSSWTVQLHGDETTEFVTSLPEHFDIIKAVPFDPAAIDPWRGNDRLHGLMIDAPKVVGELGGGTGRTFDWQALADLDKAGLPQQLFLAGGLTPDNVGEAIRIVRPYAVDVSSGVESSRGVKDPKLIQAFCEAVHQADSELD